MIPNGLRRLFAPAPQLPRLPDDAVKRLYPRYRWQILESTFIGYATFYLLRTNYGTVNKDIIDALHYSKEMIGNITAVTALSYGLGKFLLGSLSDRSNPRMFMPAGLLLTAACNFAFGSVDNYYLHLVLWALNGFFQGMGWPPCGRSMAHWFSEKERGLTFSIWNTSHNVGGAIAGLIAAESVHYFGGWQYAFYVPGVLALISAVYLLIRLRDTPQSVGLPPIEEYKCDYGSGQTTGVSCERDLTLRELFINNVLAHPWIWVLALANFFAYVARWSMLDWGALYLREVKGAVLTQGGWSVFWSEAGGIPSTILLGWLSDWAGGRRGMVAALCLLPILLAFTAILYIPAGYLRLNYLMLAIIGLFIYPVINFIVIMALDVTSKKAIGTAAGFIGLFGYVGRAAQAKLFGRMMDHYQPIVGKEHAWQLVFYVILACTAMGMVLLAFTWRLKPVASVDRNGIPT